MLANRRFWIALSLITIPTYAISGSAPFELARMYHSSSSGVYYLATPNVPGSLFPYYAVFGYDYDLNEGVFGFDGPTTSTTAITYSFNLELSNPGNLVEIDPIADYTINFTDPDPYHTQRLYTEDAGILFAPVDIFSQSPGLDEPVDIEFGLTIPSTQELVDSTAGILNTFFPDNVTCTSAEFVFSVAVVDYSNMITQSPSNASWYEEASYTIYYQENQSYSGQEIDLTVDEAAGLGVTSISATEPSLWFILLAGFSIIGRKMRKLQVDYSINK